MLRDSHRQIALARKGGGSVRAVLVELTQVMENAPHSHSATVKYLTVVIPPTMGHPGCFLEFAAAAEHSLVLSRLLEIVLPSMILV